MPLDAPKFWNANGFISYVLQPFSWLYRLGQKIAKTLSKPYRSTLPVICVGGIVVGGSGKTPTVHALLQLLTKNGLCERPVVLTRGYGGKIKGPSAVDLNHHTAHEVGDEALLHATYTPTIVCRDRAAGARLAEAMGADMIILDDGLQNCTLCKTISLLVMDKKQGTGNGKLLPAGPLREPLKDALEKCAAIVEINGAIDLEAPAIRLPASVSVVSGHDRSLSYFAFAGLGRPQKFKDTLIENDFTLSGFKAFPDHHPYHDKDLEKLLALAQSARLITTEKDFVKISEKYRDFIDVVSISLTFDNEGDVIRLLKQGLNIR